MITEAVLKCESRHYMRVYNFVLCKDLNFDSCARSLSQRRSKKQQTGKMKFRKAEHKKILVKTTEWKDIELQIV